MVETNGFIGRDKSNFISIVDKEDKEVSRKHCEVVYHELGYFVRDFQSLNGTFIFFPTGVDLFVRNGMTVMIGTYIYEFQNIRDINDPNSKRFKILQSKEDWRRVDATYEFDLTRNDILIGSDPSCHLTVLDDDKIDKTHAQITSNTKYKYIAIKAVMSKG